MRVRYASLWILAVLPVAAQEPVRAPGTPPYSLEKEAALGKQLANQVRKTTTALNSPTVQEYVDRLGQRIAPHVPGARFDYTFSVIANDTSRTHEPLALPGGAIFIPAALFAAANDEAEFGGMVAHAMEHVAQRHGTQHANVNNIANIPLVFAGGWVPGREGLAIPIGFLAQLRAEELEADFLAVTTLAHAGFDPAALMHYVERDRPTAPGTTSKVFSAMPDPEKRIAALRENVARLPGTDYPAPGTEFAAIRDEVVRLAAEFEAGSTKLQPVRPTLYRDGERPTLKRKQ